MSKPNPYESSPALPAELASRGSRPAGLTNVRHQVVAISVVMAVLLYLDRFALNAVQPLVMESLSISKTQMGLITSAFFWAYALAQVPAGLMGDRWGGRRTLTLFVALWSLAFAAQAFAMGFLVFVVFRVLQGIAQAGAYAVTAGFLKDWIEPTRRGAANSLVSMGGRVGGAVNFMLTPLLASGMAWIVMQLRLSAEPGLMSWRPVFVLYGVMGLIWAAYFFYWFRDKPEQHASVGEGELTVIRGEGVTKELPIDPPPPFWIVLGNRNVWLLSITMLLVNVGWIFLATWQPTYLAEVYNASLVSAGGFTMFSSFGGILGCVAGGFATDWLVRKVGLVWGRRLPGMVACGGSAGMYLVSQLFDTATPVALTFALVYFWNDFMLGSLWSAVQDVGGRNSGSMFGFINMSGNLGAAIFAPIIGMLAEANRWDLVFVISAGALFVAMALWLFVDPRIKLADPAAKSADASH